MDRISELPECVVHHILSFFYCRDWYDGCQDRASRLVRMSVLSKKWFDLTASFPVLYFAIYDFRSRQSFFKYVKYATSRFCYQNDPAHTLNLITSLREPAELDIVNKCIELLLKNGVRELMIAITNFSSNVLELSSTKHTPKYRLPNSLISVSMLKSLSITGCDLPSSFLVDALKFKSLTRLALENVRIDDESIKHLTTSCPLLEQFQINWCNGLKEFCVYGHQNLQKVLIYYNTRVERIDIEAPNLSHLLVTDEDGRGAPQMNVASCKKLTTVSYSGLPLPNSSGFTDFLSNFPFIENLCLATKYKFNNLKLSSHSLRTLVLRSSCDLEEIEFSTPNLDLFDYSSSTIIWPMVMESVWCIGRQSTHLKACMQCYPDSCIDTLWIRKLRLFLDKKNGFEVSNLCIHAIVSRKFIEIDKLKAIELPPYELEHVELRLGTRDHESSDLVAFVDAVLWCCRPRSLTLRLHPSYIDFEEIAEFTKEKLRQQEDQVHTKIQVVSSFFSEAQKQFRHLKSLSMVLPPQGKTISFVKEEVIQQETQCRSFADMETC